MRPKARSFISTRTQKLRQASVLTAAVHKSLHETRAKQHGLSLLELLLVAGVIAAGTAVVFNVYQNVNAASKVENEGQSLRALTENILNSYSSSADYSSLTTERAIEEGLFPNTMMGNGTGEPLSTWGRPVRVVATDINRDGASLENWGFVIAYDDVPAKACVDLISQAGPEFNDIRVEGTSIGVGANLNVTQMGQLCNRASGADIQFVFERRALQNEGGSLTLCSDSLPTGAETQVVACPAGQYGLVNQSRSAFCVSSYGSFQWTPWLTTAQTCSPCPAPETRVNTQNLTCPTGQDGMWIQSRNESRSANCPLPGPNGPSELTSWNSWTATSSWATVTNTCTNVCVLPSPSSETRWVGQSATCPTGQAGHNTWEREERRLASCPPLAPGYTEPVGNYSWSTWTATGAVRNQDNTCATCPTPETQDLPCPNGQIGNISQNRSYNCTGEGNWGSWTTTSNTCAACPAPETQTLACPSGQVGSISQTRSYDCSEQRGWGDWTTTSNTCSTCPPSETRTLSCPVGQTGVIEQARNFDCSGSGTWSNWTEVSNTCVQCPTTQTQTETQTQECPAFQLGSIVQERTREPLHCSDSYQDWTPWNTTSNTCSLPTCDNTLAGNARNYMARYPEIAAEFFSSWSQDYSLVYAHWQNTGFTSGKTSCWADPNTPCVLPNPKTQTNKETKTEERTINCPPGRVGSIQQTRQIERTQSRTATCPAPTGSFHWGNWSSWTAWSNPAWSTVSNTCYVPCAISTETQKENKTEYREVKLICWYGWSGSESTQTIIQARTLERTRTRTSTCPSETSSPVWPETWSNWSAWVPTTNWSNDPAQCPWGSIKP